MPDQAHGPFRALKVAEDLGFHRLELPTIRHLLREFRMAFRHHAPAAMQAAPRARQQRLIKAKWGIIGHKQGHPRFVLAHMSVHAGRF